MKIVTKMLMALLLTGSMGVQAQNLLPAPQEFTKGKGYFRLDQPYHVVNQSGLKADNVFLRPFLKDGQGGSRALVITKAGFDNPEAYRLHVSRDTVLIAAATDEGVLRAAQTLRQLQAGNRLQACDIEDAPAYEWRGCMLDVSRHFFPLDSVKRQVDILASYKINKLHLHLTDGAGWRIEIEKYPRLNTYAAWRTTGDWSGWNRGGSQYVTADTPDAYGGYFKKSELRDLIGYARERGITVIPEFEMPGHSSEVLAAYPEFGCRDEEGRPSSDLCPGNEGTYSFLENVLLEVMDIFPSEYIHIGGDEASKRSWKTCPMCLRKAEELGLENVDDLQAYLITRVGKFLDEHGRKLIGWDEIIYDDLPGNTNVTVWRDASYAKRAIAKGYDVIMCPTSHCYLDYYQDVPSTQPKAFGSYVPLKQTYSFVPASGLTAEEQRHVKGLQGNLWTEQVPNVGHVEYMLYPRMLAIAEIGWRGAEAKDYDEFHGRALAHVNRLRADGVNAFNLATEVGERKEAGIPVKHKALNAKVIYNQPYSERYVGQRETTLTDGRRGGWSYNDGTWQGFIGEKPLDVTIDLGQAQGIHTVEVGLMQSDGVWIYLPKELTVSVSTDGRQFTQVFKKEHPKQRLQNTVYENWQWRGSARARYVRIEAQSDIPQEWIFVDEIVVK